MRRLVPAAGPLSGVLRLPGDKSITHRALLFAMLAEGASRVRDPLDSADTRATLAAIRSLGARVERRERELIVAPGDFPASGPAPSMSPLEIDCGNSGTTARLLIGLMAGRACRVRLDGDASLRRRPLARVVDPLRKMGARITYLGEDGKLPLEIVGTALRGRPLELSVPSAQVKTALLLAATAAAGETTVSGGGASRDHGERMMGMMGAHQQIGETIRLRPGARLSPLDLDVPGDISSAAFPLAAALLVPGSTLRLEGGGLNPTRTGLLDVLTRMGAALSVEPWNVAAGGEALGVLTVRQGPLRSFDIGADEVPRLIDELPVLCVLAARAEGVSRLRGAAELRVKESDRLAGTAVGLRMMGVDVSELADGLDIVGRAQTAADDRPIRLATHGDHRLAMAFAVAALARRAETELDDTDCVDVSFPDFFRVLDDLKG